VRSQPRPGDKVRHKKTGEIFTVKRTWWPSRVEMMDGSIFYLRGIEFVKKEHKREATE